MPTARTPDPVAALPALDAQTETKLDAYLAANASQRDAAQLKELYAALRRTVGGGHWPTSRAELFGSTKSPVYKYFSEERASAPGPVKRTEDWERETLEDPALATCEAVIVDIVHSNWTGGGGYVLKGGLVLGAGIQPIEISRTYEPGGQLTLLLDLWQRLVRSGRAAQLITTRPQQKLVDLMLSAAVAERLPWTGRVSSQFEFPGHLSVKPLDPVPLSTLSAADALASGTSEDGSHESFSWFQVNADHYFVLYGPSRLGRYYLHRRFGKATASAETERLRKIVRLAESRDLSLISYAAERLKVGREHEHAYRRLTRAILLVWGFALSHTQSPAKLTGSDEPVDDTLELNSEQP